MQYEQQLSREEAMYRQFEECVASLNRAWGILAELEAGEHSPAIALAALQMALIEYGKPFRESGSGAHKRHSLGLPLAAAEDHRLHRALLEQRDAFLSHSAHTLAGSDCYPGESGIGEAVAMGAQAPAGLPPMAEIRGLIERILDVFYAQLPRLQAGSL